MKVERQTVFSFIIAFFSILLGSALAWRVSSFTGHTLIYLIDALLLMINIRYGTMRSSLLALFGLTAGNAVFFLTAAPTLSFIQLIYIYEGILFVVTGIVIIYLVEKYKKTDLMNEFKRKTIAFETQISKLETEKAALHKEVKLRDEFLSIASHELKTPLTTMLLRLQMILHNIKNVSLANFSVANLLKMLEIAEQQSKRLSRMINDLLNVSLITTGKLELDPTEERLDVLVKDVVDEFAEKIEKSESKVLFEGRDEVKGRFDKVRIEQVVTNLISNALKYGNGKPIHISVSKKGNTGEISVRDQGIGIDSKQTKKIFDLFERGVNGNGHIKGLGVGLYIAQKIVAAHGGRIRVQSIPHTGSTFTIELPLNLSKKR